MIGIMISFFDIAFGFYVKNSFNHAVGAAAREVYLDPDRSESDIRTDVENRLLRFDSSVVTTVTTEAAGAVEYRVLNVRMTYQYKSPLLANHPINLNAEARAPVLNYQL